MSPPASPAESSVFCWTAFASIFHFRGNPQNSWRRFIVLFVFCLYSLSNAQQWLTFSPVPTPAKALYGMSTSQLNMLSTIYMIVYVAGSPFSSLAVDRLGLRVCMLVGTFSNFLGAFLKLVCGFPSTSLGLIMASQAINAFSQLFVLSVPPTIAATWFRETERYTATAVGTAANAIGIALGMLLPPLWVKEGDADPTEGFLTLYALQVALTGGALLGAIFLVPTAEPPTEDDGDGEDDGGSSNKEGTKKQLQIAAGKEKMTRRSKNGSDSDDAADDDIADDDKNNTAEMIVVEGTVVVSAAGPRSHHSPAASPPHAATSAPPSPSGAAHHRYDPQPPTVAAPAGEGNTTTVAVAGGAAGEATVAPAEEPGTLREIFDSLLGLLKDVNCMLCVLGLSVSVGTVWSVNSLLAQLLGSINISESDASQMGFWNIITGIVVAIFVGPIVDRVRVYKWPIVALGFVNLLCFSMMLMIVAIDDSDEGNLAAGGNKGDDGSVAPIREPSTASRAAIYALNIIAGIPQNVVTPVGFEFLMELSYGHSGPIACMLLMEGANIVSLIELSVGAELLGNDERATKANALKAMWLVWAFLFVGFVLLWVPKNDLKRLEAERRQQAAAEEAAAIAAAAAAAAGGDGDEGVSAASFTAAVNVLAVAEGPEQTAEAMAMEANAFLPPDADAPSPAAVPPTTHDDEMGRVCDALPNTVPAAAPAAVSPSGVPATPHSAPQAYSPRSS